MRIEPINISHVAGLTKLFQQSYTDYMTITESTVKTWLEGNKSEIVGLFDADKLIGYAVFGVIAPDVMVQDMTISPEYRTLEKAVEGLDAFHNYLRENYDVHLMTIHTCGTDLKTLALYSKMGFKPVEYYQNRRGREPGVRLEGAF